MRNVRSKDNEKQHIPKQSVVPEYTCQKQSIKNLSHKKTLNYKTLKAKAFAHIYILLTYVYPVKIWIQTNYLKRQ